MTVDREGHSTTAGGGTRRLDIIAGLTAAAVVVPKALAYATIAGLPVQIGLFTASIPMAIYALLGTSRVLSFSTTTTIAILTGAELARVAPGGGGELIAAAATLAVQADVQRYEQLNATEWVEIAGNAALAMGPAQARAGH
jgi:MFS superfamily sulfate permease-like transporter